MFILYDIILINKIMSNIYIDIVYFRHKHIMLNTNNLTLN